ncbi:MAG: ankyrin repeat domain-containing protein [Burkholderiales bacterium]|nr:ankyrin repeat domain-containing protein [Burkholderiales bacterium]
MTTRSTAATPRLLPRPHVRHLVAACAIACSAAGAAAEDGQAPVWLLDAAPATEATLRAGARPAWRDFTPIGATANAFAPDDETAARRLIAAVEAGDIGALRRLLDAHGRPSARTLDGETALAVAVRREAFEIARLLLARGADPNLRDAAGQTPLMMTVLNENRWLARLLLRHGADPDLGDAAGQTPLVTAIRFDRTLAARELLAAGADADLPVAPLRTGMRRLFPARGVSGLLWAINEGRAAIVEAIVRRGARLNAEDDEVRTPLYWAVFYNEEAIARTLHAAGARLGRLALELPAALR